MEPRPCPGNGVEDLEGPHPLKGLQEVGAECLVTVPVLLSAFRQGLTPEFRRTNSHGHGKGHRKRQQGIQPRDPDKKRWHHYLQLESVGDVLADVAVHSVHTFAQGQPPGSTAVRGIPEPFGLEQAVGQLSAYLQPHPGAQGTGQPGVELLESRGAPGHTREPRQGTEPAARTCRRRGFREPAPEPPAPPGPGPGTTPATSSSPW